MLAVALSIALAPRTLTVVPTAKALPELHLSGKRFVDPRGRPVLLKGVNAGNWLLIESWMLSLDKVGFPDQWSLVESLKARFGAEEAERLMDLYRESWMTPRDWANIRDYGFNLVRVPMDYRLMEDDERPMRLRKDAWQWIDRAVDEAEAHNLYVILDLHGVQGGQTPNDHTGRSGQNKLWGNEENQARLAWLWRQIAARYRGRSAVVAYDTMNEPYGGTKPEIKRIFDRTYRSIRSVDATKPIFAHGFYDGFDFFGDPKANGWTNVGFQMHYYPGLFGSPPGVRTQQEHLASLRTVAKEIDRLDVPFLVGEMNVVLDRSGGAGMMRRTFDAHESYGWSTTIWSYKVLSHDGDAQSNFWGTYGNLKPAPQIDLMTASKPEIEAYFRGFATMELSQYRELKRLLSEKDPVLPPLPPEPEPRTVAPAQDAIPGWTASDIGGALAGGLKTLPGGRFDLFGGGEDIWGSRDSFRFLNRPADDDFYVGVTVDGIEETQQYTKGGLMIRAGLAPDAPTVLLSVFASGEVQIATRETAGGAFSAENGPTVRIPGAKLEVRREAGTLVLFADSKEIGRRKVPALSGTVLVGPVALSHAGDRLTKISYRDLALAMP